jgi:cell division protease FtsH
MDGFDTNTNVIVIAATNRPDILDPALLRPGRFDRQVVLDRPDIGGRRQILDVHAKGKPFDASVDLDVLARSTPGFSGADLANLLNEAAILAARRNRRLIAMEDVEEAIDRVSMGPARRSRIMTPRDREVVAYHEAGHAVVAHALANTDPVHKVTIVARGMAGGFTKLLPTEDRHYYSRSQFKDMLAYMLGGQCAEQLQFHEVTTGAQNDLERVTNIARRMVMEFGMSDRLGPRAFGRREELVFLGREITETKNYSEKIAEEIDEEIRELVDEAQRRALETLSQNKAILDALASALMRDETLEGEALEAILGGREPQAPAPVAA